MVIINKIPSTQTVITGRMSDGSDRLETQVTIYQVQVSDNGKTLQMTFDHDPTDAEVTDKYTALDFVDVTSDKDLITALQEQLLGTQDNFDIMYAQMLMLQGVAVSV